MRPGCAGRVKTAYEQTLGMFGLAEDLLQQAGMEFRDVVRTWIHLRDIDRDYGGPESGAARVLRGAGDRSGPGQHRHRRRAGLRGARSLPGRVRREGGTRRPCGP